MEFEVQEPDPPTVRWALRYQLAASDGCGQRGDMLGAMAHGRAFASLWLEPAYRGGLFSPGALQGES